MLIVLSIFIAPNSKGVASRKFYSALVNIDVVAKHDWCLFTISYLVYSINKARVEKINGKDIFPRGCKLALVISYFEFLLAPRFSIPNSLPRLPIWTSNLLNSYMALDALHGSSNQFGRLPLKHISLTPFNDGTSVYSCKLPEEVQLHIESSFPTKNQTQDKMIIEYKAKTFFQKCVQNTLPTIKTYIDDIMSASSINGTCSATKSARHIGAASSANQVQPSEQSIIPVSSSLIKVPHSKQLATPPGNHQLSNYQLKLPEPTTTFADFGNPFNVKEMFRQLIQDFSSSIDITNSELTFRFQSTPIFTYEQNCFPQRIEVPNNEASLITIKFPEILQGFYNDLKATQKLKNNNHSTKFSFQQLRFLQPGEKLEEVEDTLKTWDVTPRI